MAQCCSLQGIRYSKMYTLIFLEGEKKLIMLVAQAFNNVPYKSKVGPERGHRKLESAEMWSIKNFWWQCASGIFKNHRCRTLIFKLFASLQCKPPSPQNINKFEMHIHYIPLLHIPKSNTVFCKDMVKKLWDLGNSESKRGIY